MNYFLSFYREWKSRERDRYTKISYFYALMSTEKIETQKRNLNLVLINIRSHEFGNKWYFLRITNFL